MIKPVELLTGFIQLEGIGREEGNVRTIERSYKAKSEQE